MSNRIKVWSINIFHKGIRKFLPRKFCSNLDLLYVIFLLHNSLCLEIDGIISKYWWQKNHNKCGIHWCDWKWLCELKENRGMGFRSLVKFNLAFLAMHGWSLIYSTNSLLSHTLKAKYYLDLNFVNVGLGTHPSYT